MKKIILDWEEVGGFFFTDIEYFIFALQDLKGLRFALGGGKIKFQQKVLLNMS